MLPIFKELKNLSLAIEYNPAKFTDNTRCKYVMSGRVMKRFRSSRVKRITMTKEVSPEAGADPKR